jgi:pimeloyl-ACP methyl ester carboxylesterase
MTDEPGAERTVSVGDQLLRVLDEGSGAPVLLMHGFPDRAEQWRLVGARLRTAGRRTIAVDLPGFGGSTAPIGRSHYRGDHVAGQIADLLAALGIDEPIDAVGHDWGAYLSWVMCLTRPDLVRRHVAISVGHPRAFVLAGIEQKRKSTYMLLWQVPGVTERVLSRDNFRRLRAWIGNGDPDLETAIADLSRPGRLTAGLNWYRANYFSALVRRWPRCTIPTLGIWPSDDKYLAEDQMVNSGRYMDAGWRYARLDGVGHQAPLVAPERVAELVLEWIEPQPNSQTSSRSHRVAQRPTP